MIQQNRRYQTTTWVWTSGVLEPDESEGCVAERKIFKAPNRRFEQVSTHQTKTLWYKKRSSKVSPVNFGLWTPAFKRAIVNLRIARSIIKRLFLRNFEIFGRSLNWTIKSVQQEESRMRRISNWGSCFSRCLPGTFRFVELINLFLANRLIQNFQNTPLDASRSFRFHLAGNWNRRLWSTRRCLLSCQRIQNS